MNSKRSISLSTVAFAAIAILFASGLILGDQQGLAANLCGSGLGCGFGFGGYGFHHHFYPYYGGYGFHQHFYPYYGGYGYELPFP
ncbi:MAG: hypothetical protein WAK17_08835 [Candidatus Nitrosopolaris sp.]|jgi:hypothetical protein